eukprot:UN13177
MGYSWSVWSAICSLIVFLWPDRNRNWEKDWIPVGMLFFRMDRHFYCT